MQKDPRYKAIKHKVQKKLRDAYWQYVEESITPTNDEDLIGANKRLWGLFTAWSATSKTSGQLNNQGGQ